MKRAGAEDLFRIAESQNAPSVAFWYLQGNH